MGGCKSLRVLFCLAVSFVKGERTRDFAFVSLCYGRSGEEMCTGYAMAASGRMQYDYKQTNYSAHITHLHNNMDRIYELAVSSRLDKV